MATSSALRPGNPSGLITQSGHKGGTGNQAIPCRWCKDDRDAGLCSEQCAHEYGVAERRGWLPAPAAYCDKGVQDLLLAFWLQQRDDLAAHKHEALHLLLGPQFLAWCRLSDLDDAALVRGALLKLWMVRFGEPLMERTPCPKCGNADPADFWHNRNYCKHCENEWRAQQKARKM